MVVIYPGFQISIQGCCFMQEVGITEFLMLLGVAVGTIVVHTKLKSMGHLLLAILATLAGFGIMLYMVM